MSVLVIVELVDDRPSNASLEMLALARSLANGQSVIALLLGGERATAEALIARGADKVVLGPCALFDGYNSHLRGNSRARPRSHAGVSTPHAARR